MPCLLISLARRRGRHGVNHVPCAPASLVVVVVVATLEVESFGLRQLHKWRRLVSIKFKFIMTAVPVHEVSYSVGASNGLVALFNFPEY